MGPYPCPFELRALACSAEGISGHGHMLPIFALDLCQRSLGLGAIGRDLSLVLALDGFVLVFSRRVPPRINVREDQLAAHALVFAGGHHGAVLIALDHRLVTGRATSVAFVGCCHRPGIGCR